MKQILFIIDTVQPCSLLKNQALDIKFVNEIKTHKPKKSELILKNLKNDNSLKITDKEMKLYQLLIEWDDTGTLPRMLEGIIRVLNDVENPIRFSQAANSIRGLADKLLSKGNTPIEPKIILEDKELDELKKSFKNALGKCMDNISSASDKTETKNQANRKFEELNNLLSIGIKTRTHRLLELLSPKKTLSILPLPLQHAAEELAKTYKYFTAVLHRHYKDEPEFPRKWLYFQDFLILITSVFFDCTNNSLFAYKLPRR